MQDDHRIQYNFKKESVTIMIKRQYICFHSYALKEKTPFKRFSETLAIEQPQDINEVFGLARRNNIRSQIGHPPLGSTIIF